MNTFCYTNEVCKYFDALYNKRNIDIFNRYDNLIWQFRKQFNATNCYIASSSGRVELVGNHTDHNGGKVIGCGITLDIVAVFKPNNSNTVRITSEGYSIVSFDVSQDPQITGGAGLAEGVATYLKNAGYNVGGFDMITHSIVPSGAGVSSSAAFEMLVGTIISNCFNDGAIPTDVLARAGQYAENKYLNKPCGLLDQGVSGVGGLVRLNFANGFEASKIDSNADIRFVLVNTGKSHAGLSHLYASIPQEMLAVAKYFDKQRLIDVDAQQLFDNEQAIRKSLGDRPFLRAKHFMEENAIVEQMTTALQTGDTQQVIDLVNKSGDSSMYQLQNCAVDENDTAIPDAIAYARSLGNVGARVHGGGFAGTILCVVRKADFDSVYSSLVQRYGNQCVLPMAIRNTGAIVL
ncbi:MAG: galactokinase [Clostridia bacterium]|nr:galactokinase [Clostridia bacterium]